MFDPPPPKVGPAVYDKIAAWMDYWMDRWMGDLDHNKFPDTIQKGMRIANTVIKYKESTLIPLYIFSETCCKSEQTFNFPIAN